MSKFAGLNFRQKLGYIKDYYTIHIICGIAAVVVVFFALNHYVFNPPPATFINASFYGHFVSLDISDAFAAEIDANLIDDPNFTAVVDSFYYTDDMLWNMAIRQRFSAMMISQELDILIFHTDFEDDVYGLGFAYDLRLVLPYDMLQSLYDEGFIEYGSVNIFDDWMEIIGQEDAAPFGIKIGGLPYFKAFAQRMGIEGFDEWRLIIVANTRRDAAVTAFLQHIYPS